MKWYLSKTKKKKFEIWSHEKDMNYCRREKQETPKTKYKLKNWRDNVQHQNILQYLKINLAKVYDYLWLKNLIIYTIL